MNQNQTLKFGYGSRLATIFLILSLTLTSVSSGIAAPPPPDNKLVELSQATRGDLRISYHHETGQVRFVGVHPDTPIAQPRTLASNATAEQAARTFLDAYGSLFGLRDQAQELTVMRNQARDGGRTFVRFQQTYRGVPIVGGELIVQLNAQRDVISVNGELLPDLALDTAPAINAETARQIALEQVAKNYELSTSELSASEPELWVYNPILLGGPGPRLNALVWRTDVTPLELAPIDELVLVDAQLGAIALHFNQIDTARNRETYDANNGTTLPGTLVCNESDPTCSVGDTHEIAAHTYAGATYDFYASEHGRDSIDNAGMTLVSTVHYDSGYANAFWNGDQMVYGDAYGFPLADDVVAHELTHGVTDYESQLFYFYQSGAINESFSDVWGEFVDQEQATANDTGDTRWEIGEDVSGLGAGRNMQDPTLFSDPDRMGSSYYYCDQSQLNGAGDNGGVHTNSGVSNKAAYLMTDGDTFNSYTVTGLGYAKVADLYYEVQTNLLTSAADYADLYNALIQACANLGYSAADCQEVQDAVNATEMNQQPAGCPATEAPVCDSGSPTNVFFDDIESGSSNWTIGGTDPGYDLWYVPQTSAPVFAEPYATSGIGNIWGMDEGSTTDTYLAMNSDVTLPSNAYLHFAHSFGFESSSTGATLYDGGVLEYSTNSGGSWTDAGALITDNGYNGTISADYSNPLGGRSAFGADSRGYISSRADLSSLAGQNVRFRFRIGTDSTTYDYGWFIDDVRIYTCASANTAPTISGLPDQMVPMNGSADNTIDLWAYAADAEDADADLTFTIDNTPSAGADVTIDSNRYIDINPTTDWTGQTDVVIRATDSGGLSDTDTFTVNVFEGKVWDGSTDTDWHTADNWTASGVPTSSDDVVIPDVVNDPVISSSDAAANSLTVNQGAVLDLTDRTLTVEGTLTNNGTLKQTLSVSGGSTSEFLRITNLAGDQTKYYGVDITPSSAADAVPDTVTTWEASHIRQDSSASARRVTLSLDSLPDSALEGTNEPAALWAPQAAVDLVLDDGSIEGASGVYNSTSASQFIWLNRFTPDPSDFPFVLDEIWTLYHDFGGDANINVGDAIDLVVYEDADGDPSNGATWLATFSETIQTVYSDTWNVYTLTTPVLLNGPGDVLIAAINRYVVSGVSARTFPASFDGSTPQNRSWLGWYTTDPPDPATLPPNYTFTLQTDANFTIRGYGSTVVTNTAPIISGLPDKTVPTNGSADNAIDLWTYASDAEDASSVMTYTIINSPIISAGVNVDSNRYIDIDPATDWTGVTEVEVQVQDTGGLTDTDTFQVTITDTGVITNVTVSVSGNQFCAGRTSGVERCYDITPAAALDATVRFYLTEAERNSLTLGDLLAFHYDGDWIEEPGPYSSGGTGDAQYVQVQNVDDFSRFALGTEADTSGTIYLPIILKRYPPVPYTPVLNAISNSDNDGNYTVDWDTADLADTYTLQEDDNSAFSSPTTRYTGANTSWSASNHAVGTFYYRVKATNSWGDSGWSNVRSVKVSPPTKFYATEDAVVIQKFPSSNYGSATDMWVGYGKGGCIGSSTDPQITRSLVKFNLSAIPAGTSISSARLYLDLGGWCYGTNASPRTVTTYRTLGSWSESSITWSNMPGFAEAYGATAVGYPSAATWYSFDVTNLVRGWVNGSLANYGITIRGPEGSGSDFAWFGFFTSESSYDPYILITYAGMAVSEVEMTPAPLVYESGVETLPGIFMNAPCRDGFGSFGQAVCSPD